MLDNIFKFLTNLARKVSEKGINISRNKTFIILLIGIIIVQGIGTYNMGECLDCDVITSEEAIDMINDVTVSGGKLTHDEMSEWYTTRTYTPFTSVGKFVITWLSNLVVPVLLMSLIFFLIYFISKLLRFAFLRIKKNKLEMVSKLFTTPSKINKK